MSEMQLVDYKNNSSEKMNCKRSLEKSIDSNKSTQIMAIKDEKLKVESCLICSRQMVQPTYLPCSHFFCFLCVKVS